MRVGLVGGTGPAGSGIGARLARAGHDVFIGSRKAERAEAVCARIREAVPDAVCKGMTNDECVATADVIILTIKDDSQRDLLHQIGSLMAGKVVVSMANPLRVGNRTATYVHPPEGSLAEEAQGDAPDAHVVSAFHELRVEKYGDLDYEIESDTLVCGDDGGAKEQVMQLARDIGLRPIDAGGLINSRYVEAFVAVLITVNFRYKATTSLRITGL